MIDRTLVGAACRLDQQHGGCSSHHKAAMHGLRVKGQSHCRSRGRDAARACAREWARCARASREHLSLMVIICAMVGRTAMVMRSEGDHLRSWFDRAINDRSPNSTFWWNGLPIAPCGPCVWIASGATWRCVQLASTCRRGRHMRTHALLPWHCSHCAWQSSVAMPRRASRHLSQNALHDSVSFDVTTQQVLAAAL